MALAPNALFDDVDDVWRVLCPSDEERLVDNDVMERWINMASSFMDTLLNRPCKPQQFHEFLDGTGKPFIYLPKSPAIAVHSLRIWYSDFADFDDINVIQTPALGKELDFQARKGRLVLLRDAPQTRFLWGIGNIEVTFTAGFDTGDLEVIKEAAIEMINVRYSEKGRNPREQTRADSMNTTSAFTKGDFDELPWMMTQAVLHYRKRRV